MVSHADTLLLQMLQILPSIFVEAEDSYDIISRQFFHAFFLVINQDLTDRTLDAAASITSGYTTVHETVKIIAL